MTYPSSSPPPVRAVSQADLVRAALIVIATLVGLQLLWSARLLLLTAFLGLLFGLATSQAVDAVRRRVLLPRSVIAPTIVFGVVGILVLVGLWSAPVLVEQSQELRTKLPEAVTKVETWFATSQPRLFDLVAPPDTTLAPGQEEGSRLLRSLAASAPALRGFAFGVVQSTVAVLGALILVIFLAIYIAISPATYRRGFLLLIPLERRDRVAELLTALGGALRTWFATQLIAMVVIGAVTTILLALIGVRGALPLGVLAGIFEFIPNVGPVLSAIPAVLMGLADSPQMALTVVGLYWGIQFLENNLLIPYLMSEQLDLPPALTLVTQVVMAYVFGFLGLFVAIPLLATIVVAVRVLWVDEDLPPLPTMELPAIGQLIRRTLKLRAVDLDDAPEEKPE